MLPSAVLWRTRFLIHRLWIVYHVRFIDLVSSGHFCVQGSTESWTIILTKFFGAYWCATHLLIDRNMTFFLVGMGYVFIFILTEQPLEIFVSTFFIILHFLGLIFGNWRAQYLAGLYFAIRFYGVCHIDPFQSLLVYVTYTKRTYFCVFINSTPAR